MPQLMVEKIGPSVTVQDLGRPGFTAQGLPCGGAADRLALLEAAAILDVSPQNAVVEMMGFGGVFHVDTQTRFAMTGAEMQADIDGVPVRSYTTTNLQPGQRLTIGGARKGVYGYLAFAGGIDSPVVMGSRAAHLTANIGGRLGQGDMLPLNPDPTPADRPFRLPVADRLGGGVVRIMQGPQSDLFSAQTLARFSETPFTRNARGNRQGIRLDYDGPRFSSDGQLNLLSDLVLPGDVQLTGDGTPYVLLAECQTIGGYPRIGTVIPADLPKVAQAGPGAGLQFQWLNLTEADATAQSIAPMLSSLRQARHPMIRDPHDIADLLRYQLISGVTAGDPMEEAEDDTQR